MPNNARAQKRDDLPGWKALAAHKQALERVTLRRLFEENPERSQIFSTTQDGIHFDFSRHGITQETLKLLTLLARECDLEAERERMFSGEIVNETENRPVLHTALRGGPKAPHAEEIAGTLSYMQTLSADIRANPMIQTIITIGIGGSDCGPQLVCEALKGLGKDGLEVRFLSNIDPGHTQSVLEGLSPDHTLFIISSKSFSTQETMANAAYAKNWARGEMENFIAVTGNRSAALNFGIKGAHILPVPDWVGGRYSLWSAVGLPIALALGFDVFQKLLEGAAAADTHFRTRALDQNIPVLMALLSLWQRNFEDRPAQAVLPYDQRLALLPRYIQQLSMESNGKSVSRGGAPLDYPTAPIVFGEVGTNGQHAFYQLLHQGGPVTPCDFILSAKPSIEIEDHHAKLIANALAQAEALAFGQGNEDEPHRSFPGNRPSSLFILRDIEPYTLGMLLAFYEHKTFCEGILWDINSFDQWGVELGKRLSADMLDSLEGRKTLSPSAQSPVEIIRRMT